MSSREKESLEVMVARIDERVEVIHNTINQNVPGLWKAIRKHDRYFLVAQVVVVLAVVVAGASHEWINAALGWLVR